MEIENSDRFIVWGVFSVDVITGDETFIKKFYESDELAEFIQGYVKENIYKDVVIRSWEFGMGR